MTGPARASLALLGIAFLAVVPASAEQRIVGDEPPHANAAVFPLLEDLGDAHADTRVAAAMALRELGPVAWPAVPALQTALADPVVAVRKSAAGALGGIGPAAADAVPSLAAALLDRHRFVRSWAAMALAEIGPAGKPAAAALVQLMRTDTGNLRGRSWAASALPKVHAEPELAVPALIQALASDPSEEVRSVAVLSIQAYGVAAAERGGVSALVEALSDRHWKVRGNAACALPALGEGARVGASRLGVSLRDEAPYVRGCAADAVGRIGDHEVASELEPLLADVDAGVRRRARRALEKLRAPAKR